MSPLAKAVKKAKRVYLCGNGGSAANANHIANDLVSCGIKAIPLTEISTLTAIANDYGYQYVFSHQLKVFGEKGDLLIALSGSGNSPNILNALRTAKDMGLDTWAIVGGGLAKKLSRHTLTNPNMQESEQVQLEIGHRLLKELGGKRV